MQPRGHGQQQGHQSQDHGTPAHAGGLAGQGTQDHAQHECPYQRGRHQRARRGLGGADAKTRGVAAHERDEEAAQLQKPQSVDIAGQRGQAGRQDPFAAIETGHDEGVATVDPGCQCRKDRKPTMGGAYRT